MLPLALCKSSSFSLSSFATRRATAAGTAAAFVHRRPSILQQQVSSSSSSSSMKSVADLRKEYSEEGLLESEVPKEPHSLFTRWLEEAVAAQVVEPNAMCLSTVGPNGRPSARFVLLKGLDARGFVFYTNYESRKGQELLQDPATSFGCLTFWWGDLERSVRLEGLVECVDEQESQEYFASRPRGSQMGAWASRQSQPIASREALEAQYESVKARFDSSGAETEAAAIPKPPHWGGFRLVADRAEFWKGRNSRLHDRLVYTLTDANVWSLQRLQP